MTESQTFWPSGNLAETAAGIDAYTEIASYAYPPGERQRYTASGWQKAVAAGFANLNEVIVADHLKWHEIGCVKRYGAESDQPCQCEKLRASRERS